MPVVRMRFYAELGDLLAPGRRGREFERDIAAGCSVKDVIEGLGVPHTEVDLLLVDGVSVGFGAPLRGGERVSVYPVFEALDIGSVSLVRARPLRRTCFAADVHLGRLAAYLRLAGFDTLYRRDWTDATLVEDALRDRRIILTRDRGLLMRSAVTHGYLVRQTRPRVQLMEVLDRFDLWAAVEFLGRCSVCNGRVIPVAKEEVEKGLPPGTRRCYQDFWRCDGCGRVYWQGAHYRSLRGLIDGEGLFGGEEPPAGEERHADERDDSHSDDAGGGGPAPGGGGQRR
jgi:uncharacterized protein with PIN domain